MSDNKKEEIEITPSFMTLNKENNEIKITIERTKKFEEYLNNNKIKTITKRERTIEQWVSKINEFSSQYGNEGWAANKVIGPPRVYPQCCDNQEAWAPQLAGSRFEFLDFQFEKKVKIISMEIFETNYPGGLISLMAYEEENEKFGLSPWTPLYEGATRCGVLPNEARIFSPKLYSLHPIYANVLYLIFICYFHN